MKVLDYGLAKALEGDAPTEPDSELSQSPTLTRQGTQIGVILGTAAYMSPEQAKGKSVDKRTDIWAFGAVLYEMLTARRAFGGEDVAETLAAVIRAEPDFDVLPSDVSPTIRRYLSRCLVKDPRQRVHDAADMRLALGGAFDVPSSVDSSAAPKSSTTRRAAGVVGVLAIGIAVGAFWWSLDSNNRPAVTTHLSVELGGDRLLSGGFELEHDPLLGLQRPSRRSFALAPSGRDLVFTALVDGTTRLFHRSLSRAEAVELAGTDGGSKPFFSPDGDSVAFVAGNELRRLSLVSGQVRTITVAEVDINDARGAAWAEDGTILMALRDGIHEVPAAGGQLRRVSAERAPGTRLSFPSLLPDGRTMLVQEHLGTRARAARVAIEDLETGDREVIVEDGSDPRLLATGHLAFMRGANLMVVPLDPERFVPRGTPVIVLENVMHAVSGSNGGSEQRGWAVRRLARRDARVRSGHWLSVSRERTGLGRP